MTTEEPFRLKRILCPTDFSETATAALQTAVMLARAWFAEIRVMHAFPLMLSGGGLGYLPSPIAPDSEGRAELMAHLRRFAEPALAAGIETQCLLREGDPDDEIVRDLEATPTDLVVMGRHAHGLFDRWILGSVTESVVRRAPCPVLAVTKPLAPGRGSLRILCALDERGASAGTLAYAKSMAHGLDADLHVLHVAGTLTSPHRGILGAVQDAGIDLIVMGSHAGETHTRLFLGSTVRHVLRGSPCPVLVVPARLSLSTQPGKGRAVAQAT
jgi:nucleotide-binding universal stress UspA family protein